MRFKAFFTAVLVSCVAGSMLSLGGSTANDSQMGLLKDELLDRSTTLLHERVQRHTSRKIKFKRDGLVTGFFDHDEASEADWKKFTTRGGALMCGINANDEEAGRLMGDTRNPPSAASQWTGDFQQDMAKWHWTEINPSTYSCKMNEHWKIPSAMKALGLNGIPASEGGDNTCYRIEHWDPKRAENGRQVPAINQWYTVDGVEYQATNAHYEFAINRPGGALYGFFLDSPVHSASSLWHSNRRPADRSKLPLLRAFSDILWGFWTLNNPDPTNINFFFMMGISNDQTNALIATCLRNKGESLREWPGVGFSADSDEGRALLGSPNGAAFAYFLLQHKGVLGGKRVGRVTVFRAETDDDVGFVDPNLVFHVVDGGEGGDGAEEDVGMTKNGSEQGDERLREDQGLSPVSRL